jgi:hypothetical protein
MASSFAFQTGMPILGRLAGVEILNLIAGFLTTGSRLGTPHNWLQNDL